MKDMMKIKLTNDTFEINGVDLSRHVRSVSVAVGTGLEPVCIVELANVELDADVQALITGMVTSERVSQILDSLDPAKVEQEVLNNLGMGDKLVPKLIEHLKGLIRGS